MLLGKENLDQVSLTEGDSVQAKKRNLKIYIEGHGCSASLADTEILSGLIEHSGHELVASETEADLTVLVTCSVKSVTEQRMLSRIRDLSSLEGKHLVVAGCLAKAEPKKILNIDSNLTLIGPSNLDTINMAVDSALSGRQFISTETKQLVKSGMPRTRTNNVIGVVEIASGCLSSCTFCQVKLVKGAVFSYPEEQIVKEVSNLVNDGVKEVWLTSTDNSAYGRDSGTDLTRLLSRICAVEGEFKIRTGMLNPLLTKRMTERLLEEFSKEKVFKFLHMPVQSGSNRILREMQRGYSIETYYETVETFRRSIPDITLSTDVIVGFPSETEDEFEESMDLLKRSEPDIVNLSRFGARQGTKAAIMPNQIPSEVSKSRSVRMTGLTREIALSKNQRWIGWEGEILIDEIGEGALIGRNFAYKPCVVKFDELDGSFEEYLGNQLFVRVIEATSSTLRAIPLRA
jgi:threonylcarbamoyladenosine tRNA methylthiotransferase CDKAL1